MKKFLKPLVISAIALFTISCSSSDDNNPNPNTDNENEKALVVLDKIEVTKYHISIASELTKPKLDEQSTYKFEYDNTGKVSSILYAGKSDIYDKPQNFSNKIDYTYNNGLIKEIKTIDTNQNSTMSHEVYEYNDKQQVVRILEKINQSEYNYTHDKDNLISLTAKVNYYGSEFNYKNDFTYDNNNNPKVVTIHIVNAVEPQSQNFSFDNKKNPFINMNINYDLLFELKRNLPQSFKFTNNLLSLERTPKGQFSYDFEVEYEYNKDNLPTKATSYVSIKKEYVTDVLLYTYKTIKVKK